MKFLSKMYFEKVFQGDGGLVNIDERNFSADSTRAVSGQGALSLMLLTPLQMTMAVTPRGR